MLVSCLLKLRTCNKQLGTYIKPLLEKNVQGVIYHSLNHCVAITGRLTSSNPNLQNVTNGETDDGIAVKKAFISRFGSEGRIIEVDFAQLEMIALAFLSGDAQLIDDIRSGRDMHRELFNDMHGRYPSTKERKAFKRLSFGLVYGAGAAKIALNAKIKKAEAEKFIATFYKRYPGVESWHASMNAEVNNTAQHLGRKDEAGIPIRELTYMSPTGRCYHWKEEEAPEWLRRQRKQPLLRSFSPTQIKNYPVQGLATGDIVPLAVGKLYRALYSYGFDGQAFLVNTVHDSVVIDCHVSVLEKVCTLARQVLTDSPKYIEMQFGFEFPLPLEVGVSYGLNWLDQTELSNQLQGVAA
jgi:DNA polymerase I-like protein with 3'-5' exonuclease and polymerase domains